MSLDARREKSSIEQHRNIEKALRVKTVYSWCLKRMSGVFVLMRDQQAGAPQRSELKAQLMYATAIDAQQNPHKAQARQQKES